MGYEIGPYDPCPCGSGAKYKFCCAAKAKAKRHGKFPVGTVAYYGPDDRTTTKIVAGVILFDGAPPILERFIGEDAVGDPQISGQVKAFFAEHGVKSVVVTDGTLGCPHEEGIDFPLGRDCPVCPFWAGKQGTAARRGADDGWGWELSDEDDGDYESEDESDDEVEAKLADEIEDEIADGVDGVEADADEDTEGDRDWDAIFARVETILGQAEMDFDQAMDVLFGHLGAKLSFPFRVTGVEDFQWEEPYVIGGWNPAEYKQLRKKQPSYRDHFELISIERRRWSEWMMFDEDLAARVRRISDGKEFFLGLSELKAIDRKSANYQLLDDYAVWFVNSR